MEKVWSGKIGRYDILTVLGRGKMGDVILARDESLARRVAIRKPAPGGSAPFRFEPQAAALRHPNIPTVYEIGVHQGEPFIVMEYVEGETLKHIIESKRDLDLISRLRIIEQVCSALAYAHEKGVFHLHLKASSIIVQPDGTAKLTDFGFAVPQNDDPDSADRIDGRCDIHSAGVALFQLLTGEDPLAAGDIPDACQDHPRLGPHLHDHSPALDQIVAKSLAPNSGDCFQSAEEFADALHDVIKGLKRAQVTRLVKQAEFLKSDGQPAPALALLDQAIRLDPSHPPARKLRQILRDEQQRLRRAERLRDHFRKSNDALRIGKLDLALRHLRDAQALDPSSAELIARIHAIEEKALRLENSARALADAGEWKMRGDPAGALRIIAAALEQDPDNNQLLTMKADLLQQLEFEAQRGRMAELQDQAARALAARDFDSAEKLLGEAAALDPANPEIRQKCRELAQARQRNQSRAVAQNIEQRVHDLIRADAYDQARDIVDQALDTLPGEPLLLRLKARVEAEASRYDARHIVDLAIAQAGELVASSPLDALRMVRTMLDNMPGEERLVALERSLRLSVEGT